MKHGQTHYVLGWVIILISHNWPVLLALAATLVSAFLAWRKPTRRGLAAVYSSVLFVVAYEYHKHIGPTLQDAANYLLSRELLWMNRAVWLLVGPIATVVLVLLAVTFGLYALAARLGQHPQHPISK